MKKVWFVLIAVLVMTGCSDGPKEKRSERPALFRVEYIDNECGPTGAHLKLLEETLTAATGEQIEYGFQFYVPEGMKTPDDPEWPHAVAGNKYELEGYYYYHIEYGRRILHPRVDLVGWRLLAPYLQKEGSPEDNGHFDQYWDFPKEEGQVFKLSRTYKTECN